MRLRLTLITTDAHPVMPVNYQYPLSAVIYKIIQRADARYAEFLHQQGYGSGHHHFKLFTFSDLRVPFKIQQDRLLLTGKEALLTVCFHLPEAMEHFIKGLFANQRVEIADAKSRVHFTVGQVELQQVFEGGAPDEQTEAELQPLSAVVAGRKNEKGHYDYLSPMQPEFATSLLYNWKEKYTTQYSTAGDVFERVQLQVVQFQQARSRLITIKANSPEETKVRGFTHFKLRVSAPREALELLMNAGAGLYNAQGMGCLGVVNNIKIIAHEHTNNNHN